jgi:integrase
MSGSVWDLSGTDNRCHSYGPGHLIHWIHFNHSMREPSAVIPVTADVEALYIDYRKARAAAGRPDLRWHDLRHGAVLAAAAGATLAELMARLGHSTPQAAMRYQHAAAGRDHVVAAAMSQLAGN